MGSTHKVVTILAVRSSRESCSDPSGSAWGAMRGPSGEARKEEYRNPNGESRNSQPEDSQVDFMLLRLRAA